MISPATFHALATTMARMLSIFVALFSITSAGLVYRAASDTATTLSPQGCRMSYMSPSYIVQSQFDTSWTPLAKRYSLLLYREVGWEDNQVRPTQHPILFPYEPSSLGESQSFSSLEMLGLPTRFVQSLRRPHDNTMRHRTPPPPSSPRAPFHHSTSSLVRFLICCLRQADSLSCH